MAPEPQLTARDGGMLAGAAALFVATLALAAGDEAVHAAAAWFDALAVVAPFWVGAAGWGWLARLAMFRRCEAAAFVQPAAGAATMLVLAWLLAWAGLLNQATGWALCASGAAALLVQGLQPATRSWLTTVRVRIHWGVLLSAPALALFVIAAACPPGSIWRVEAFGYDTLSYHLQLPREWLELGAMVPLPHNVYGFFPNLMEAGFMLLGALRGNLHDAALAAQFLHVSMAVLAAVLLGRLVARVCGVSAGMIAAAALLATPWTLIVGTSAYNELTCLAFAAAALLLVLDARRTTPKLFAAGLLLGAATLAKLTAGPMLAVPITLAGMMVGDTSPRWRRWLAWPAVMALGGVLMLCPYFIRTAAWTGNPVFPFAASTFGNAHWTAEQAETWHAIHAATDAPAARANHLLWSWLFNPGYGGVGGAATTANPYAIDRFHRTGGPSPLWIAALIGGAWLLGVAWVSPLTRGATRRNRPSPADARVRGLTHGTLSRMSDGGAQPPCRFALAMLLILAVQLAFWLLATKQAPRYAYFTLLPGCALAGAAIGALASVAKWRWLTPALAVVLVGALLFTALESLGHQRRRSLTEHAVNMLDANTRTYLVADAAVFYADRPIAYFTAWDVGPLGGWMAEAQGDAAVVTHRLREAGFTHVWVHWSELRRIHATIGRHDGLDADALARAARDWTVVADFPPEATLFALP